MTTLWRLFSDSRGPGLDGSGAARVGGRWNHRGTAVVYTSDSPALAVLELLVHMSPHHSGRRYAFVRAELPRHLAIREVMPDELPDDWRDTPAPPALADLGTAWARAADSAVLSVPSAVVPEGRNYVLNPEHPDFGAVAFEVAEPHEFDMRLLALLGARSR